MVEVPVPSAAMAVRGQEKDGKGQSRPPIQPKPSSSSSERKLSYSMPTARRRALHHPPSLEKLDAEIQAFLASLERQNGVNGRTSLTAGADVQDSNHEGIKVTESCPEETQLRASIDYTLRWSAARCDKVTLQWLLRRSEDPVVHLVDEALRSMQDGDGYDLVSQSIVSSSGFEDREDVVRLIVTRRQQAQSRIMSTSRTVYNTHDKPITSPLPGWSSLHLAALISTPPLVSFLLNHGYSPSVTTSRGLTPLDVVSDIPSRKEVTLLLQQVTYTGSSDIQFNYNGASLDPGKQAEHDFTDLGGLLDRYRGLRIRNEERALERKRRREECDTKDQFITMKMTAAGFTNGLEYLLFSYEAQRTSSISQQNIKSYGASTLDFSDEDEEVEDDDDSDDNDNDDTSDAENDDLGPEGGAYGVDERQRTISSLNSDTTKTRRDITSIFEELNM